MSHQFMVFDEPPCNNREVPLSFLNQLWPEFVLGFHVNYFNINQFHGVGLGSTWIDQVLGVTHGISTRCIKEGCETYRVKDFGLGRLYTINFS